MRSSFGRLGAVLLAASLVLATPLLSCSSALAQDGAAQSGLDAEARSLFEAGRTAFAAGRFEAALARFQEAYELSRRPALLYNIGTAADRLRRDAQALEAFRAYLAAVPDAPNREEVEARLLVLEQAVAEDEARAQATPVPAPDPIVPEPAPGVRAASDPDEPASQGGSVLEEWWFWTIVGVVVVGAGVGVGVGVAMSDPGTQGALPGTGGVVISALGAF